MMTDKIMGASALHSLLRSRIVSPIFLHHVCQCVREITWQSLVRSLRTTAQKVGEVGAAMMRSHPRTSTTFSNSYAVLSGMVERPIFIAEATHRNMKLICIVKHKRRQSTMSCTHNRHAKLSNSCDDELPTPGNAFGHDHAITNEIIKGQRQVQPVPLHTPSKHL